MKMKIVYHGTSNAQ